MPISSEPFRRWAVLTLLAALIPGCGDDDGRPGVADAPPPSEMLDADAPPPVGTKKTRPSRGPKPVVEKPKFDPGSLKLDTH